MTTAYNGSILLIFGALAVSEIRCYAYHHWRESSVSHKSLSFLESFLKFSAVLCYSDSLHLF